MNKIIIKTIGFDPGDWLAKIIKQTPLFHFWNVITHPSV